MEQGSRQVGNLVTIESENFERSFMGENLSGYIRKAGVLVVELLNFILDRLNTTEEHFAPVASSSRRGGSRRRRLTLRRTPGALKHRLAGFFVFHLHFTHVSSPFSQLVGMPKNTNKR